MSLWSHLKVFGSAWDAETRRRKEANRSLSDTEFLPAALEVTETPPSPIGRSILWLILLASVTAITWSFLSEIDTVAVAEGRLVPEGRLRTVEATDQGIIRAIHVREGAHVNAGDVLIELDPTIADADMASARTELSTSSLTRARDNALMEYARGAGGAVIAPKGAASAGIEAEQQLVAARISEFEQKQGGLAERRSGTEASARSAEAEIQKLQRTLPLLQEQVQNQKDLEKQGFGARQKRLQVEQALIAAEQDLRAQSAKLDEARSQIAAIDREAAQSRQEFIGRAAQERAEAEGVVATRGDAVRKADQKRGRQKLTAPVSGTIQEVTVTTIGEAPEVGKPLITIVPDGEPLVVEALLLNKDAGFVRAGQKAAVKIEAYPFTRYGVLTAKVERVSPDATVDQQRGLVFPIRLKLAEKSIKVDGKLALITSGMSVTAEVVTGRRRVIDYLWSPIAKASQEAARER
jgi:hemolysin D